MSDWEPWETYKDAKTGHSLRIDAPPCANCVYFKPVKRSVGVNLCHYDEESINGQMEGDFSCYSPKKIPLKDC